METLAKADIFFVVTTIFVAILAVFAIIAGIYLVKILRNLRDVSNLVKSETLHIAGDIENIRSDIKRNGLNLSGIFKFFKGILHRNPRN